MVGGKPRKQDVGAVAAVGAAPSEEVAFAVLPQDLKAWTVTHRAETM
jgi:hypothetical protein